MIRLNENNLLSKIITGDKNFITKKDENFKDIESFEVKLIFDRKANKIDNNLLKDNNTKKLQKIQKENIININKNKLKFPQDNVKKKYKDAIWILTKDNNKNFDQPFGIITQAKYAEE